MMRYCESQLKTRTVRQSVVHYMLEYFNRRAFSFESKMLNQNFDYSVTAAHDAFMAWERYAVTVYPNGLK